MAPLVFVSVFVIATCGLVYELISGALASYLLGDSVTQFSTVIGTYLFAMGVGSYLSKFVKKQFAIIFVQVELLIGLVGGSSAAFLFLMFDWISSFRIILYTTVFLIGMLVGFEIPLLMRVLKDKYEFKDLVANIFTFDYVGALLGSLLFPLVLAPHLGLVRTCFLFGIFNVLVAFWAIEAFKFHRSHQYMLRSVAAAVLIFLGLGFVYADRLTEVAEAGTYQEPVVYAKSSPYQRVVLTKLNDDMRLYLNGHLQFSSRDEYRYHESLVHVGLSRLSSPKRILILGGGDGMAAREVFKYSSVTSITLVDLDPAVTRLFKANEMLGALNGHSLSSPRLEIVNVDAFIWIKAEREKIEKNSSAKYDFIVVDFPDPTNFSVGKLYTTAFYRELKGVLAHDGLVTIQSTSPLIARKSYWCINHTLDSVGFRTWPYYTYVPSFGIWGYVLAGLGDLPSIKELPSGLKFLDPSVVNDQFHMPQDMADISTGVNRLNNQILVHYYEDEWARYTP